MQKIRTTIDHMFFLIFNILFSMIVGYVCACLILHRAQPVSKHIILPIKILLSRSITLLNSNSGGWWDNPGADVFLFAILGFIICSTLMFIIYRSTASKSKGVLDKFKSEIHGNAQFATFTDIEKVGLANNSSGVVMCKFQASNKKLFPIINSEVKHTLVIGGTGDNKTTSIMIPSLLSINKNDYSNNKLAFSSAFIYDLKFSIYPKTAGWGIANGVYVIVLDPTNPNYARFNIFNEIDVYSPCFTDDVERIVQIIMDPGGKKYNDDDFWKSHGRTLLSARIAFELYKNKAKPKNRTSLQKIAYMFRGYDLENDCAYSMDTAFNEMRDCDHPYIKSAGYMYESTEPRTFSGYLSTAQSALNLYVSSTLGDVTSDSTFELYDLLYRKNKSGVDLPPTWLYLSIPFAEMERLEPFVQLFFSAYLSELKKEDEDGACIKKYPIRIFADEFTKMGKFDSIGYNLGMLRGYCGIVTLLTQSLQDINNLYGEKNTIMTNCTYIVSLGVQQSDEETAKSIATQTGHTTVKEIIPSMSVKKGKGVFARNEKTFSYTPHIYKKTLMSPDEVIHLDSKECLVMFKQSKNLLKGYKFKYFEDPELVRKSKYYAPEPSTLESSINKNISIQTKNILKAL